MSHDAQVEFVADVKKLYPEHFHDVRVLEIGSLNVNGSVRWFFTDCDYTGLDVVPGSGVDIISPAHQYDSEPFDTVISCESLEHDVYWPFTLEHAVKLLKTGGLLVITCASGNREEHGTRRRSPEDSGSSQLVEWGDYYRNLSEADFLSALDVGAFETHMLRVIRGGMDLQFWGIKA